MQRARVQEQVLGQQRGPRLPRHTKHNSNMSTEAGLRSWHQSCLVKGTKQKRSTGLVPSKKMRETMHTTRNQGQASLVVITSARTLTKSPLCGCRCGRGRRCRHSGGGKQVREQVWGTRVTGACARGGGDTARVGTTPQGAAQSTHKQDTMGTHTTRKVVMLLKYVKSQLGAPPTHRA